MLGKVMQWLCQVSQGPDLRALTVGGGCFCAPVQGAMPVFEAEKSKDLLGAVKNSAMKQQKQQHQIHQ
jgi:hypothetical protein